MKKTIISVVVMLLASSLLIGMVLIAILPKGKYSDSINLNVDNNVLQKYTSMDILSKDFEERNEITIDMVVQGELKGNSLVGTFVNYKGQEVSKTIEANYEPIKEYLKDIKMGDLLRVMLKMTTEPIYEEAEGKEDKKATKTLMGRSIGGNSKRKIVGNKETIEIIDIEVDKTIKGKYDLSDEVGNDEELPF